MIRPLPGLAVLCLLLASAAAAEGESESPRSISVEFRGTLKDGVRQIATLGGLNLIVTGDLSQPAEIYLKDIPAEQALESIASSYQLKVHRQGSIWTVRPLTQMERGAPAPEPVPQAQEAERQTRQKVVEKLRRNQDSGHSQDLVATGPVEVGQGQVVGSAVSYGSTVTVRSGAVVEEDVVSFGGNVVLEPGSVVEGDAVAFGGKVEQPEGAVVEGDVVSFGGLGAVVAKGVQLDSQSGQAREGRRGGIAVAGFFLRFTILFGLGFLFLMFAPARMKQIERELRHDLVKCGLTGIVGSIALGVLSLLLVVTLVGIPAAIALWALAGVAAAMGFAALASAVGLRLPLFRSRKSQAVALAGGLLVLMLIAKIPVLGTLAMTVVGLAGLGAIIRTRFGQSPRGTPQPDTRL